MAPRAPLRRRSLMAARAADQFPPSSRSVDSGSVSGIGQHTSPACCPSARLPVCPHGRTVGVHLLSSTIPHARTAWFSQYIAGLLLARIHFKFAAAAAAAAATAAAATAAAICSCSCRELLAHLRTTNLDANDAPAIARNTQTVGSVGTF